MTIKHAREATRDAPPATLATAPTTPPATLATAPTATLTLPAPARVPLSSFALLDGIGFAICAIWPLMPPDAFVTDSLYDLASYASRLANCTLDEAIARIDMLQSAHLIGEDATIHPDVQTRLNQIGAERMRTSDEPE